MNPIVEKIRKLLALATSSNPNEAALAASRAQELMVKYAIEEADLVKQGTHKDEPIEVEQINLGTKKIPHWLPRLMNALAKGFFCQGYYVPGVDIRIVGRASDRASLIATFNFVRTEVERLAEAGFKLQRRLEAEAELAGQNVIPAQGKTWKRSFCQGAVTTIHLRLAEESKKLEAATEQANPGTAIVLANRALAVRQYVESKLNLRSGSRSRVGSHDAYGAGQKAGWSVNLGKRATKQIGE